MRTPTFQPSCVRKMEPHLEERNEYKPCSRLGAGREQRRESNPERISLLPRLVVLRFNSCSLSLARPGEQALVLFQTLSHLRRHAPETANPTPSPLVCWGCVGQNMTSAFERTLPAIVGTPSGREGSGRQSSRIAITTATTAGDGRAGGYVAHSRTPNDYGPQPTVDVAETHRVSRFSRSLKSPTGRAVKKCPAVPWKKRNYNTTGEAGWCLYGRTDK